MINKFLTISCLFASLYATAQPERWQQRVEYKMDVDMDVSKHQFDGNETIVYYNNSPDELDKVFFHLYFNAFQPGSEMDVRSRTISDPDPRVAARIAGLSKDSIGFLDVKTLRCNGKKQKFAVEGTILEVKLNTPIPPHGKVNFELSFEGQVPLQIRRSGWSNKEGIEYSMAQWYPKICEYDYQGWHADPYVGREFYGVWGDFDVTIHIDQKYILGATGTLVNADEIGYGYEKPGAVVNRPKSKKLGWHFQAQNVHDFVWAADPDYTHVTKLADDGTLLHFLYQKTTRSEPSWAALPDIMAKAFPYIDEHFGQYPYPSYSFIQGGDGGMEYPMATLITGERSLPSLLGTAVHELMHSWYQGVLGSNEALYPWMDEGFDSYAGVFVMNYIKSLNLLPGYQTDKESFKPGVDGFCRFALSGMEEPLSTHSDHYLTNRAYSEASYNKGSMFLLQLSYVVGKQAFDKGMLDYYNTWKFKHPNPNDFIRVMEKASGLELDWYKEYMVNTTHTIDYAINKVEMDGKRKTRIVLDKIGVFPMPVDVVVTYEGGEQELFTIPLDLMRGEKMPEDSQLETHVLPDWPWTNPQYEFTIREKMKKIDHIEIDPSYRMLDVNRDNNIWKNNDKNQ